MNEEVCVVCGQPERYYVCMLVDDKDARVCYECYERLGAGGGDDAHG